MCEIFNRQLSDDAMQFWMEELQPHYGPFLVEAIRAGCREKWMPSIGWVIECAEAKRKTERRKQEAERKATEDREIREANAARLEKWNALTQEERNDANADFDKAWDKFGFSFKWRQNDPDRGAERVFGKLKHEVDPYAEA
jgi:hypothetical protein